MIPNKKACDMSAAELAKRDVARLCAGNPARKPAIPSISIIRPFFTSCQMPLPAPLSPPIPLLTRRIPALLTQKAGVYTAGIPFCPPFSHRNKKTALRKNTGRQ